jgi:hypothetical protein
VAPPSTAQRTASFAPTRTISHDPSRSRTISVSTTSRPTQIKSLSRLLKAYPSNHTSCGPLPITLNVSHAFTLRPSPVILFLRNGSLHPFLSSISSKKTLRQAEPTLLTLFPPLCDRSTGQEGYTARFGVTYIDYEDDCKRYPKDSAAFMREYFERRIESDVC